jgi:chromosome segregation ATPase
MAERKRGLRPLETLKREERDHLYKQTHAEVQGYHYESQTIRLLKKEKKQREIEELLEDKMIEFKRKNSELEDLSRKLKEDQDKTRMQIESRKFPILAIDHKTKQEAGKSEKEAEIILAKDIEVKKKTAQKDIAEQELKEIQRKFDNYLIYKEILDRVVKESEDYDEIPQLIGRCRNLKSSVDKLSQSYRKIEEETEKEKESFFKEMNELSENIGVYTGLIHKLENQIEKLNDEIIHIQSKQEQHRISKIEHKSQIAKVELSIKNIHSNAIQSRSSIAYKAKMDEERKTRLNNTDPKALNAVVEKDSEDPDLLVVMLQELRQRYADLKKISENVPDEVINSKTQVPQTIEDHGPKARIAKKSTIIKNFETNKTFTSNKEGF